MSATSRLLSYFRSGAAKSAAWTLKKVSRSPADAANRLTSALGYQNRPKAGERIMADLMGGMSGITPGTWTGNRIEQTAHYRHWVWKAIRTIMELSTKEAPMVVQVHPEHEQAFHKKQMKAWLDRKGPKPEERRWGSWRDCGLSRAGAQEKAMQIVKPHESFEYLSEDDPLQKLMHRPNEWDTGTDLDQELVMNLEMHGASYEWLVPYKNSPGIAERWIMPSSWVWPIRTGKTHRLVDFWEVRPIGTAAGSVPFVFEADEFIYYHYKSPLSKIDGQSPLQAGSEVVDCYEQAQLARFFSLQNGANVGDVIQLDASLDPNQDSIVRFLAAWKNKYQGVANFNAPGILPPGAELIRRTGNEMLAYSQDSDQMRDYILGMWGLTKSVVGFMEDANRASFEAALAQTFYLVINPRLTMIDTIRTERLASRYGRNRRIFHRDLTPADRATEQAEWGLLTKVAPYRGNEVRTWMGLEPIDEGDEVITPSAPGADPMAGMGDDDIMGAMKGEQRGEASDNVNGAAGFPSQFKRWTPSLNGVHS